MKNTYLIIFACYLLAGCGAKKEEAAEKINIDKEPVKFFPVTSFIKGQIFILDSLPVTPLLITKQKGKIDSLWLPTANIKPYFQPFLEPEIKETNLREFFRETRFNDQTLNAITFTYDPKSKLPDSLSLKHWDVYVNPDKGNVTKVYLLKEFTLNNERITQQLTWQTDKYAKISTILNKAGQLVLLKEEMITWDF